MLCILIPSPFIRRVFHIEYWGGGAAKVSLVRKSCCLVRVYQSNSSCLPSVSIYKSVTTVARSNFQVWHQVLLEMSVIVRSRPHIRVKKRMVGVGCVRVRVSGRIAAGVAVVQCVSPGEEAKVQQVCLGAVAAALTVSVKVKVLHLHEPLGPELPPHPLTEHGQVDQLSCRDGRRGTVHINSLAGQNPQMFFGTDSVEDDTS